MNNPDVYYKDNKPKIDLKPFIKSAQALSNFRIEYAFERLVDPETLSQDLANYGVRSVDTISCALYHANNTRIRSRVAEPS